jgi:alkylation response protein AidB-like acyl-CoA dehydrogenase
MDFNLTEEQLMVQQAARDFAQNELLPGVIERDEKQIFPAEQVKKMGELGFMGMMVDPIRGERPRYNFLCYCNGRDFKG